jgi:hypothetical protein
MTLKLLKNKISALIVHLNEQEFKAEKLENELHLYFDVKFASIYCCKVTEEFLTAEISKVL